MSKNNDMRHPTYKEFFDMPKNYHAIYNNSNMTQSDFFRKNAPVGSVAKVRHKSTSSSIY